MLTQRKTNANGDATHQQCKRHGSAMESQWKLNTNGKSVQRKWNGNFPMTATVSIFCYNTVTSVYN